MNTHVPTANAALLLLVIALMASAAGARESAPDFAAVDRNGSSDLSRDEARHAGLLELIADWKQADANQNHVIDPAEYAAFIRSPTDRKLQDGGLPKAVGRGQLRSPESALWDEQRDVYLVSNVNGPLTAVDDNGFISQINPDGGIAKLKWIDGGKPDVTLHAPKDMLFWGDQLVVADTRHVRFFERRSGKPIRAQKIEGAHMLNALALSGDGRWLFVSDTGGPLKGKPGAVHRLEKQGSARVIASGDHLDRPNGLAWHEQGLLVASFAAKADQVYRLNLNGDRTPYATLPQGQLDGLLALPDGSFAVTSWKGHRVYRILGGGKPPQIVAEGIPTPAQVGYDGKRQRLLVPALKENELQIHPLSLTGTGQSPGSSPGAP